MKKLVVISLITCLGIFAYSCGGNSNSEAAGGGKTDETANGNPSYDPNRGEGKFTKVDVPASIDTALASAGAKVFNVKCQACHKLTGEKLVGPGWKGVTARYTPEWIMNFITNTDAMLNKDPKAQAQLEICLVRMPNQNVSDEDARAIYEFQRKNDEGK